jgi:hypothetical protein
MASELNTPMKKLLYLITEYYKESVSSMNRGFLFFIITGLAAQF